MRNLGEILSERESIAQEMQVELILILMGGLGGGLKVLLFPKYCYSEKGLKNEINPLKLAFGDFILLLILLHY